MASERLAMFAGDKATALESLAKPDNSEIPMETSEPLDEIPVIAPIKRGPGRPRKIPTTNVAASSPVPTTTVQPAAALAAPVAPAVPASPPPDVPVKKAKPAGMPIRRRG